MPAWIYTVLFFTVVGLIYLVVEYVGNKIVDKGTDAVSNAIKREKNSSTENEKAENLADCYRH